MRKFVTLYRDFLAALVIMNPDRGFMLILRNCVRMNGDLSTRRTKGELGRLLQLITLICVIPVGYIVINVAAIWVVHNYVVPLPFVMKLATVFHMGEESWEANIVEEFGSVQKMAGEYEEWTSRQGISQETSKVMQKMLWHGWPQYVLIGLVGGILFYLVMVKLCLKIVRHYRQGLHRRKEAYFDLDLQTIPRDQILY
jgi:hypothetical protein